MSSPKSKHIEDKIRFLRKLFEFSDDLIRLFGSLKKASIESCGCSDWGYTDKPDFRLAWEQTICELIPKPSHGNILVMLRVDEHDLSEIEQGLTNIQIRNTREQGKPGLRWIESEIGNDNQIDEAVNLIRAIYRYRSQTGWNSSTNY